MNNTPPDMLLTEAEFNFLKTIEEQALPMDCSNFSPEKLKLIKSLGEKGMLNLDYKGRIIH